MKYSKSKEWHNLMFEKFYVRVRRSLKRPLIVIKKREEPSVLLQVQDLKHIFTVEEK